MIQRTASRPEIKNLGGHQPSRKQFLQTVCLAVASGFACHPPLVLAEAPASGAEAEKSVARNAGTADFVAPEGLMHVKAGPIAEKANLTMNTGPLPDGSIHPADVAALREAGERIRKNGFPEPKLMDRTERKKAKKK